MYQLAAPTDKASWKFAAFEKAEMVALRGFFGNADSLKFEAQWHSFC